METYQEIAERISDKYNIPATLAIDLMVNPENEIWMDRRQLSVALHTKAKVIDKVLANLELYDLENQKCTTKAILRSYVKFAVSKTGNVKEVFNAAVITSIFFSRMERKKTKRFKKRSRRQLPNKL